MSLKEVASKLASLEAEIKVLKSELQTVAAKEAAIPKEFTSLKGIWKGQLTLTEEEIRSAEIRLQ